MSPDLARRILEALERAAGEARTRVDLGGGANALAQLVSRTLRSSPGAGALADPGARAELKATDAALGERLARWLDAPLAQEARMRRDVAAARVRIGAADRSLAAAMHEYRSPDEARRRSARAALDPTLDALAGAHATLLDRPVPAVTAPPPRAPAPPPRGTILRPSADLVSSLAAGGPLDPGLMAALATTGGELIATPAGDASPGEAQIVSSGAIARAIADLARATSEAVTGAPPSTYGRWRAAAGALDVADFRVAALAQLGAGDAQLPFEQPGVPLARDGAASAPGPGAAATIAHLLGVTSSSGERVLGATLAVTAASRGFVRGALRERPRDDTRAARAFAVAIAERWLAAHIAACAAGDVETLRDLSQDLLGAAPPAPIARWFAAEASFAGATGEERSLYAHDARTAELLASGAVLAERLREEHDEDWYRNPHLTPERLDAHAAALAATDAARLLAWLHEAARL